MKDGYYYFIPASADKTDVDKSLGYLCVTKYPKGASYSIQCSLSQEIAAKIGGQGLIEIFLSPTTYITAQSILIGKIFVAPKVRLFVDSSLQASAVNVFDEDQYAIITANGRTLCYSVLVKKKNAVPPPDPLHEIQAEPTPLPIQQAPQQQQQVQQRRQPEPPNVIAEPPRTPFQGKDFDPFDTTNPAYKWYIYDNRTDGADSVKNIQELDKMFRYFNVQYDLFAKMNNSSKAPYSDTFLKMSYYSVQIAGHVLRGEYRDPETKRKFTIIGLPGWNTQNTIQSSGTQTGRRNNRRRTQEAQQASSGTTRTIRECSRWLAAKRKPSCSYNRNYNGYWLYYFDAESGMPVKAIMKTD
ncbi:MAG: hypothetical protein KIC77_09475 [Clostridiales bacterium]|jgi:hypothetical protein|nr:hypothetical protein [Clostridiales bacterium]